MNEINFYSSTSEYSWLSNFYLCNFKIKGVALYTSSEHFYQSQKIWTPYWIDPNYEEDKYMVMKRRIIHKWIKDAPTPHLAFKAGRSLRECDGFIQEDFDKIKIKVMRVALWNKFSQNPDLRQKLIETGDAIIHEDSPTDMFWGKKGGDKLGILLKKGGDKLGILLMELRELIKTKDYLDKQLYLMPNSEWSIDPIKITR